MRWGDQSSDVWLQMCWQPCTHPGHIKKKWPNIHTCVKLSWWPSYQTKITTTFSLSAEWRVILPMKHIWNLSVSTLVCMVLSEAIGELQDCILATRLVFPSVLKYRILVILISFAGYFLFPFYYSCCNIYRENVWQVGNYHTKPSHHKGKMLDNQNQIMFSNLSREGISLKC